MSRILHHLSLPVSNLKRSAEMYDAALARLGFRRVAEAPGFIGYGTEPGRDRFALMEIPYVRSAQAGFHLAFGADSTANVDAFHDAACSHGALDNGLPGPRPHYGDGYYAAFVLDPDGHHLEAVYNPHGEEGKA